MCLQDHQTRFQVLVTLPIRLEHIRLRGDPLHQVDRGDELAQHVCKTLWCLRQAVEFPEERYASSVIEVRELAGHFNDIVIRKQWHLEVEFGKEIFECLEAELGRSSRMIRDVHPHKFVNNFFVEDQFYDSVDVHLDDVPASKDEVFKDFQGKIVAIDDQFLNG